MLGSEKLVGFMPTRKPKEARRFYGEVLGLRFVGEDRFAIVFDANGTSLRITNVSNVAEFKPARFTILGWEVSDVGSTVKSLRRRGVKFERYDGIKQDELGIWTAPGGTKVAWFNDPDGNILSVSEH